MDFGFNFSRLRHACLAEDGSAPGQPVFPSVHRPARAG
jgi:hypothetical protein